MLMSITLPLSDEGNKKKIIDQYEELGYTYSHESYDNTSMILSFRGPLPKLDVAAQLEDERITTFLEFQDGTLSPLFIRKERSFDD